MKEKLLTFFQKYVLFWGVVLLFVAIPLYPKLPVFSIKGTYVPIRAEDFLIAFLLTLWIILFLFKRVRLTFDVFFKSVAIYFVVGLISLLSALFLTHTVVPHLGFLHFLRRIEYFSVLLLVVTTITTQKRMFVSLITLFLTTVGVIIYGIGQQYFSWPVISTMNEEFSKGLILHLTEGARVNSTFAGHYDLAAFLVLVLAVLAATVILAKKRWQKVSLVFLGIASYWLLLETASRISFGAYIVAIFLVLFLANTKWQKLWVVPVIGLSVLGLFYSDELSQRFSSTIPKNVNFKQVIERFLPRRQVSVTPSEQPTVELPEGKMEGGGTGGTGEVTILEEEEATYGATPSATYYEPPAVSAARSANIRYAAEWPRAIRAFLRNPLLGTGYSSITLATDNDYLRALGETGLLGLTAFLLLFVELFRKIFRFLFVEKKRGVERILVIGFAGSIIGFLLNAIFIDVFEASKVAILFWMIVGLLLATLRKAKV